MQCDGHGSPNAGEVTSLTEDRVSPGRLGDRSPNPALRTLVAWRAARGCSAVVLASLLGAAGCASRVSRPREVAAFNAAGPAIPTYSLEEVRKAEASVRGPYRVVPGDVLELRILPVVDSAPAPAQAAAPAPVVANPGNAPAPPPGLGPYRVVVGDVLELHMAGVLRALGEHAGDQKPEAYSCRVNAKGVVTLPAVGEVPVKGKTLLEVEEAVVAAYFPKYVKLTPSVLARVSEPRTFAVAVVGAVARPGRYALPANEMSLVPLLTRAGGIQDFGASRLLIQRADGKKPLSVAFKDGRTPAVDAELAEGDVVEVVPGPRASSAAGGATGAGGATAGYSFRVSAGGMIDVPSVGEVAVGGKTLAEVEEAVASACVARNLAARASVMARVAEFRAASVSVMGGVGQPGKHELRGDELTLLCLLQKAGGIAADGARMIRIYRSAQANGRDPLLVPVRDQNVPFADVALKDGDTIEVERLDARVITIVGLVTSPGVYPYPRNVTYTLQQVLAIAGGTDKMAGPEYATVSRLNGDGKVVTARFELGGKTLEQAASVVIKPGDVISVPHTTWTKIRYTFFSVFHFGFGAYGTVPLVRSSGQ